MPDNLCTSCGSEKDPEAFYCRSCGLQLGAPAGGTLITNFRIVTLCAITFGAYIIYWMYLTWDQLDSQTKNDHYPVCHALTFLIPVYGLFRIYHHMQIIQQLALKSGIETNFSPKLPVTLIILNFILAVTSYGVTTPVTIIVIEIIQITLIITALIIAQDTLNNYWIAIRQGSNVQKTPFTPKEFVFIVILYSLAILLINFQPIS